MPESNSAVRSSQVNKMSVDFSWIKAGKTCMTILSCTYIQVRSVKKLECMAFVTGEFAGLISDWSIHKVWRQVRSSFACRHKSYQAVCLGGSLCGEDKGIEGEGAALHQIGCSLGYHEQHHLFWGPYFHSFGLIYSLQHHGISADCRCGICVFSPVQPPTLPSHDVSSFTDSLLPTAGL